MENLSYEVTRTKRYLYISQIYKLGKVLKTTCKSRQELLDLKLDQVEEELIRLLNLIKPDTEIYESERVPRSGIPGITWYKKSRRWAIHVRKNKRRKLLGYRTCLGNAIKLKNEYERNNKN